MAGKRFAVGLLRVTLEVMRVRIDDIFAPARSYVATAIAATVMVLIAAAGAVAASRAHRPHPAPSRRLSRPRLSRMKHHLRRPGRTRA